MQKYYKLFVNNNGNICPFKYDYNYPYYQFLKEKKKEGYRQFLITSDLMILIIINLLKNNNSTLLSLHLYDTDADETEKRIKKNFEDFSNKKLSEEELNSKLNYLESEFSIDITEVTINNSDYGKLNLRSNGVFSFYKDKWKEIILELIKKIWENDN